MEIISSSDREAAEFLKSSLVELYNAKIPKLIDETNDDQQQSQVTSNQEKIASPKGISSKVRQNKLGRISELQKKFKLKNLPQIDDLISSSNDSERDDSIFYCSKNQKQKDEDYEDDESEKCLSCRREGTENDPLVVIFFG